MSKYHGGVVAGTHVRECGSKPWRATFKIGSRIDKTKTFTDELGAKKWRKKFSNKHGRTTNRWRKHPTLANTVEMLLNRGVSVLFDEDNHPAVAQYVWCIDAKDGIYTTGRVIASTRSTYNRNASVRVGRKGHMSMLAMLAPGVIRARRFRLPVDNVFDNRLSNIGSASVVAAAKRPAQALPPSSLAHGGQSDEDFLDD